MCSLTLDEMAITTKIEYSGRKLSGYVTISGQSGIASHALVFMLSGISTRWKQTVGFYFTGATSFATIASGSYLRVFLLIAIAFIHCFPDICCLLSSLLLLSPHMDRCLHLHA
jgi:hypothetical protein